MPLPWPLRPWPYTKLRDTAATLCYATSGRHLGLRLKILQLELPDPVARFLCEFLADWIARVKVGDHTSSWFPLHTEVPQVSVLSPLLYATQRTTQRLFMDSTFSTLMTSPKYSFTLGILRGSSVYIQLGISPR